MEANDFKPHTVYFAIGMNPRDVGAVRGYIGVVERLQSATPAPLVVRVRNLSGALFTLSVSHSNDNDYNRTTGVPGAGDTYGAVNVRYGGASVASVNVQPGGEAVFVIESIAKPFFLFKVTQAQAEAGARGTLHVLAPVGELGVRSKIQVP